MRHAAGEIIPGPIIGPWRRSRGIRDVGFRRAVERGDRDRDGGARRDIGVDAHAMPDAARHAAVDRTGKQLAAEGIGRIRCCPDAQGIERPTVARPAAELLARCLRAGDAEALRGRPRERGPRTRGREIREIRRDKRRIAEPRAPEVVGSALRWRGEKDRSSGSGAKTFDLLVAWQCRGEWRKRRARWIEAQQMPPSALRDHERAARRERHCRHIGEWDRCRDAVTRCLDEEDAGAGAIRHRDAVSGCGDRGDVGAGQRGAMLVPDRLPVAAAGAKPQQPRRVPFVVAACRRREIPFARPTAGREPRRRKIRVEPAGADCAGIIRRERDAITIVETGQPLRVILPRVGVPADDGVEQPEDRGFAAARHVAAPSSSRKT